MVVVNTHNKHPVLGSLGLLNCHRVVYPLTFGSPGGFENWTLADWCDQCHRKGGLTVWTEAAAYGDFQYGAPLADLVLGRLDALEVAPLQLYGDTGLFAYSSCLDVEPRLALVGGSGKRDNCTAVGSVRTYAQLQGGEEFTYRNWIEACRAGRTFITSGPLLTFTVNGQGPGSIVHLSEPGARVQVRAAARSLGALDWLMVTAPDSWSNDPTVSFTTVAKAKLYGPSQEGFLEEEITVPASGWLVAECGGRQRLSNLPAAAHTSRIYVQVAHQPTPVPRPRLSGPLSLMDRLLEWVDREGRFENEAQRADWISIIQAAKDELIRRQER
jgi:hypothetical protein